MFAYCNNAPVSFKDNTGTIPQAVEDAMVHNRVLKHICAQNSALRKWKTCIYYNGTDFKGGWGFCDLYNADTGEVWELKNRVIVHPAQLQQLERNLIGILVVNLKILPTRNSTSRIAQLLKVDIFLLPKTVMFMMLHIGMKAKVFCAINMISQKQKDEEWLRHLLLFWLSVWCLAVFLDHWLQDYLLL